MDIPPSTIGRLSRRTSEALLAVGALYEVGGVVRDSFLGRDIAGKDCDYLICGAPLEKIVSILKKFGRVDLVGKSFGVIKFAESGARDANGEKKGTIDIALPRVEKSVGHGHKDFEVQCDPSIPVEIDLARRDFTINAMAVSVADQKLIDPYGGKRDLEARLLRMVTPQSFAEDPLRMLRAAQFAARFDLAVEEQTFGAMCQNASLVTTVSAERIADELNKLLERARRPSSGFRILQLTGVLKHFLPELEACVDVAQPGGFHRWNVFEHTLHVLDAAPPRLRLRLAVLFHDINKPQTRELLEDRATFYGHDQMGARTGRQVMRRLRYSNDLMLDVSTLVERHMFTTQVTDKGLRRLVRRVGIDLIFDLLDLRRADVFGQGMGGSTDDVDIFEDQIRAELAKRPPFGLQDLAVDGTAIMNTFHLPPGPKVGEALNHLMERVLDNPEDNTADKLLSFAREFLESSHATPPANVEVNKESDSIPGSSDAID